MEAKGLRKKYNLEELENYLERGLLEKTDHPSLPLSIWNYSRGCQFESSWDEITLGMRGTILDHDGNLVAGAFPKFFNYEEVRHLVPVSGEYVYVQEKMDGSLGILFWYEGEWHLATKGSFASDQALKGMGILRNKYNLANFHTHVTYLCEIIYPENRIVVDYKGEEKIVFIGANIVNEELHWTEAKNIFKSSFIKDDDIVQTRQYFSFGSELYRDLKEMNTQNSEGHVLRFHPGNFRMKIKFADYVRLHKILTGFSNVSIWEYLRDGKDISPILEQVPDEFDVWVRKIIKDLNDSYESKLLEAKEVLKSKIEGRNLSRKEIAEILQKESPLNRTIVFCLLDGSQKYKDLLWRTIRPEYQKPFWYENE